MWPNILPGSPNLLSCSPTSRNWRRKSNRNFTSGAKARSGSPKKSSGSTPAKNFAAPLRPAFPHPRNSYGAVYLCRHHSICAPRSVRFRVSSRLHSRLRLPKARRRDSIALDRNRLRYLNALEGFNCMYCSYGNGVLAYAVEVAARTEQHWCTIKHARRVQNTHDRYAHFLPYGDAHAYREGLDKLRCDFKDAKGRK
jgi:hypothetical protein